METRTSKDRFAAKPRHIRAALRAALCVACIGFLVSCSRAIGWGVVLWNMDSGGAAQGANAPGGSSADGASADDSGRSPGGESASASIEFVKGLEPGQIVPIYVKSTLRKVYIVGIPGTGKNAELAQWRVERFSSKSKAKAFRKEFELCLSLWGIATRGTLTMRETPDNTSRQVYRLREKEMLKLIKKVDGGEVKTGERKLSGDWYQALAADGTLGYVFSNTLSVFDSSKQSLAQSQASVDQDKRVETVETVLSKTWRPEIFRSMIDEGRYDLDEFSMRYGMFTDLTRRQIRIELPNLSKVFTYEKAIRLRAGLFGFQGTDLQLQVRGDDLLTVTFPDENGKSKAVVMALVEEDMEALARAEETRRQSILEGILAKGSTLTSDSYGEIGLSRSRRFTWKGYDLLSPAVIPGGMGTSGEIVFDRYVDDSLAGSFDGVVNFAFDSLPKGDAVRFYYKLTADGIKLEQMPSDAFDPTGLVAVKRGNGPIVAFFSFGG
jgi:hypothetical protein